MTEQKTELERNAVAEARTKEQQSCQRTVDMKTMDSRSADCRMGSRLAGIDQEAAREAQFQQKQDQASYLTKEEQIQLNLAKKLNKKQRKEERVGVRGVRLKDDPEIRDFYNNVDAAFTKHKQQVQQLLKEQKIKEEKLEQQRQDQEIISKMMRDEKRKGAAKSKALLAHKTAYQVALMQQLGEKEAATRAQYNEKLRESSDMNELVREMNVTSLREQEKKKENKKKLRQEKLAQIALAQELVDKKKQQLQAEELKRQKEVEKQDKDKKERTSKNDANRRKRDQTNQTIAEKISQLEKEKREREDLIRELQEQEELERQYGRERHDKDRAEAAKCDMRHALLSQMDNNTKARNKEKEREKDLRTMVDAKVKEDDQKEKLKQEKAKEAKKKYANDLTLQIKENKERKCKDKELEAKRAEHAKELQKSAHDLEEESDEVILQNISQVLGNAHKTLEECRRLPIYRELHSLNLRHKRNH